jgi:hypothetical protein
MRQEDGSALTCRWQLRPSYNTWYGLGYVHIDFVHVRLHSLMQVPEADGIGWQWRGGPGLEEPSDRSSFPGRASGSPFPCGEQRR